MSENDRQDAGTQDGKYKPKSLISSWAQKQESQPEKKSQQAYKPKSLIADWGQKDGAPETDAKTPPPTPGPEPPLAVQNVSSPEERDAAPESTSEQKRSLWEGEPVPPPPPDSIASQLVRDAAKSLSMKKPKED